MWFGPFSRIGDVIEGDAVEGDAVEGYVVEGDAVDEIEPCAESNGKLAI